MKKEDGSINIPKNILSDLESAPPSKWFNRWLPEEDYIITKYYKKRATDCIAKSINDYNSHICRNVKRTISAIGKRKSKLDEDSK